MSPAATTTLHWQIVKQGPAYWYPELAFVVEIPWEPLERILEGLEL